MKTLILTASYWGWHNTAAEAIQDKFQEKWEKVSIIDFVEEIGEVGSKSKKFHENVVAEKLKLLWRIAFKTSDYRPIRNFIQKKLKKKFNNKLRKIVNNTELDLIIITNPLWLPFFDDDNEAKKAVVVTDAINIHSFWYQDFIDHYFLIDKFSKKRFVEKFWHNPDQVHDTFFPMKEKFFIDKEKIENERIYILLDSQKYRFINKLLKLLATKKFCKEIVVIKHRNQEVFDKLKKNTRSKKLKFEDFVNLKENYWNIDIFIWKPGGAVIAECIATSTPIVVPIFIPGQEEGNIELMEKLWIWFYSKKPKEIVERLETKNWNTTIPVFEKTKNAEVLEDIYEILVKNS